MVRIQLHLTEQQDRRLRLLARKRGLSRAELIRQGVEWVLRDDVAEDPLLELVGTAGAAGRGDLSESHDEVLYAAVPPRLPHAAEPQDEE